jgi:hypothetical protein
MDVCNLVLDPLIAFIIFCAVSLSTPCLIKTDWRIELPVAASGFSNSNAPASTFFLVK